jgi:2-polyprenyl-3-methyl-5-hydroxy-6-metoxy-1,4-benzoquinol methylase
MRISSDFAETADIETSSEDYARRFAGAVGAWFLKVQEEATLRMLASYPGASVLDVGGGHGQLAGPLIDAGFRVEVLGSAEVCSARLRGYLDAGCCAFRVGDILDLPYPDRSFDIVISYRLLPHVTRWPEYLRELARVARQAVVVDYPSIRSINYLTPRLFGLKKRLEGNTRTYTCFEEQELLAVFRPLGFVPGARHAEFFLPMVLHRKLKAPALSTAAERLCRACGLTEPFGSPVILKLVRDAGAVPS